MLPIHTILHPTDFTDRSEYAFHLASALTRDYGARLVLLHVVAPAVAVYGEGALPLDPEVLAREAQERLNRLEVPGANVRAERLFAEGDPATEILRVAREIHADDRDRPVRPGAGPSPCGVGERGGRGVNQLRPRETSDL